MRKARAHLSDSERTATNLLLMNESMNQYLLESLLNGLYNRALSSLESNDRTIHTKLLS